MLDYEPSVIKGFAKSRLKKLESKNTERISAEARLNDAKTSLIQIMTALLRGAGYLANTSESPAVRDASTPPLKRSRLLTETVADSPDHVHVAILVFRQ